ncbi:hypothetical protein [Streptomyces scabiei]|uniref:hypothetical protein n=1 Tax=Streptomyces scabiei TaxID=1930 RepID=UPI0029AB30B7|nr:hypothetical protein [Streptomyces scabiei]MDX3118574.1 hypothetical protein [Streptomyces scabiei]
MEIKAKFGPTHDTDFFAGIQSVFDRYPDVAKNYSIRYIGGVIDVMKVDLERQVGLSNVQDGEIVTKFIDRSPDPDPGPPTDPGCYEWRRTLSGEWRCTTYIVQKPPG